MLFSHHMCLKNHIIFAKTAFQSDRQKLSRGTAKIVYYFNLSKWTLSIVGPGSSSDWSSLIWDITSRPRGWNQ